MPVAATAILAQLFNASDIAVVGNFTGDGRTVAVAAVGAAIVLILFFGKSLLAIFNSDPQVVAIGYLRLMIIMVSHIFTLLYEVLSGYLRGFGISFVPAVLTTLGVCGIRIEWIQLVFPHSQTFQTIMIGYPVSLIVTAFLIFIALICYHPAKRFYKAQRTK